MRITDIRTMVLEGPRSHGVGGEEGVTAKLIIRVDTDEGVYGLGEADYFMGVLEAIDYIKSWLLDRDPLAIRPHVSALVYGALPQHPAASRDLINTSRYSGPSMSPTATPTGPIIWGMSGVEMALCDLAGKILNTPVYNLLGGRFRDRARVYLDRSAPRDVDTPDAWKKLALLALEKGFSHIKFDIEQVAPDYTSDVWNRSISASQMRQIVQRLSTVRDIVGWDVELCVDGHMHYTVTDAIRLAEELAPLKLLWLEDPTPITNPDACAAVRARSPIPICVGEMFIAEQFRLFIDRGACDIIHPDILFCGGVHETRRIADYADLHYIPMAMHNNGGCLAVIAAAHVAAASRNFLGLEYHYIESEWVGSYVRREGMPLFLDGSIVITDAPGFGVELDPEVCATYLASGQSLF